MTAARAALGMILFLLHPATAGAEGEVGEPLRVTGVLGPATVWRGEVVVTAEVQVPAGASLAIEGPARIVLAGPESRIVVAGEARLVGREAAEVVVAAGEAPPKGAAVLVQQGGALHVASAVFQGAPIGIRGEGGAIDIREGRFEGLGQGLSVAAGRAVVSGTQFRQCTTGIFAEHEARLEVDGGRFVGGLGVRVATGSTGWVRGGEFRDSSLGVELLQAGAFEVSGNRFAGARVGVELYQTSRAVAVSGNVIENGAVGIVAQNFSESLVSCNRLVGLEIGLRIQRFSRPQIMNNLLSTCGSGLVAGLKSAPLIEGNSFRDCARGIFLDLSSYPVVRGNNFDGRGVAVALGDMMSADWERRVGSEGISSTRAGSRESPRVGAVSAPREYEPEVDASGNWWGPAVTAEMDGAAPDANISVIQDGYDRPEVSYPGFGDGSYRLDRVRYRPWEREAVSTAGPDAGVCETGPAAPPSP